MLAPKNLVIIPGWGGDKETWDKFILETEKQKEIKVHLIEIPCFGSQLCDKKRWGVLDIAQFVEKKIKEKNLSSFSLLAHSMGGKIALYLAAKSSNKPEKLILLSPFIFQPNDYFHRFLLWMIYNFGYPIFLFKIFEKIGLYFKNMRQLLSPQEIIAHKKTFKQLAQFDSYSNLKELNIPTLLIWSKNDWFLPLKNKNKIIQTNQKILIETLGRGGHMPHIKNTEEFYKKILKFLE